MNNCVQGALWRGNPEGRVPAYDFMTIDEVLRRLEGVRKSGHRWIAKCPAHEDHHPSLSIAEGDRGKVLLKCFAGCRFREIASALNLHRWDWRKDNGPQVEPTPRRVDWAGLAAEFQFHADALWVRSQRVLEAARGHDIRGWTDEEVDAILWCVTRAYGDLQRADMLEEVAFHFRCNHLTEIREKSSRRST